MKTNVAGVRAKRGGIMAYGMAAENGGGEIISVMKTWKLKEMLNV